MPYQQNFCTPQSCPPQRDDNNNAAQYNQVALPTDSKLDNHKRAQTMVDSTITTDKRNEERVDSNYRLIGENLYDSDGKWVARASVKYAAGDIFNGRQHVRARREENAAGAEVLKNTGVLASPDAEPNYRFELSLHNGGGPLPMGEYDHKTKTWTLTVVDNNTRQYKKISGVTIDVGLRKGESIEFNRVSQGSVLYDDKRFEGSGCYYQSRGYDIDIKRGNGKLEIDRKQYEAIAYGKDDSGAALELGGTKYRVAGRSGSPSKDANGAVVSLVDEKGIEARIRYKANTDGTPSMVVLERRVHTYNGSYNADCSGNKSAVWVRDLDISIKETKAEVPPPPKPQPVTPPVEVKPPGQGGTPPPGSPPSSPTPATNPAKGGPLPTSPSPATNNAAGGTLPNPAPAIDPARGGPLPTTPSPATNHATGGTLPDPTPATNPARGGSLPPSPSPASNNAVGSPQLPAGGGSTTGTQNGATAVSKSVSKHEMTKELQGALDRYFEEKIGAGDSTVSRGLINFGGGKQALYWNLRNSSDAWYRSDPRVEILIKEDSDGKPRISWTIAGNRQYSPVGAPPENPEIRVRWARDDYGWQTQNNIMNELEALESRTIKRLTTPPPTAESISAAKANGEKFIDSLKMDSEVGGSIIDVKSVNGYFSVTTYVGQFSKITNSVDFKFDPSRGWLWRSTGEDDSKWLTTATLWRDAAPGTNNHVQNSIAKRLAGINNNFGLGQ